MNKIKKWLNQQDGSFCIMNSNINDECFYSFILSKNKDNIGLELEKNNKPITTIASGIDEVAYEINNLFTLQDTLKIENKEVRYSIFDRELLKIVKSVTVVIEVNKITYSVPNHQNRIFELFKKYDMKSYHYNNQSYEQPNEIKNIQDEYYDAPLHDEYYRGLTNQNENFDGEYEDYIWAGMSLNEIETNPERYNGRWSQEIWRKNTVWRIL